MEMETRRGSEVRELESAALSLRHTPVDRVADIAADMSMPGVLEPTGSIWESL